MERTNPPSGSKAVSCRPWMRPISSWSAVTTKAGTRKTVKLVEIFGVATQHNPADPGRRCCVSHLRKHGGAGRFKKDSVGARIDRGLDAVKELLTLQDAVILRIDDLEVHTGFVGSLTRSYRLLDLEIVVVVGHRKQEARLGHGARGFCKNHTPKAIGRWRHAGNVRSPFPVRSVQVQIQKVRSWDNEAEGP